MKVFVPVVLVELDLVGRLMSIRFFAGSLSLALEEPKMMTSLNICETIAPAWVRAPTENSHKSFATA